MVGIGTYGNGGKFYLTKLLQFRLKGKWQSLLRGFEGKMGYD
jgi:hypothetical protein